MSKLLVGFTAGLLVGILFAPDKGTETRERIARRGRELKDKFDDMIDSIASKFDDMTDEAENFADQTRAKAYTGDSNSWAG